MKKILLTTGLCLFVAISFAQKKAVKEAKSSLNSKNFTEARALIAPALTNEETARDPETWKIAGDIENEVFVQERNNQIFQKEFKEPVMYDALIKTYRPYIVADSLAQIPDEKGKIKNKVRKDIVNKMLANHPYFINGGVYYNDKKDFSKAADFFYTYWQIPSLSIFEDDKANAINTLDSTFQTIKYYAVICAIQADDHNRAIDMLNKIKSEPFVKNSTYQESDIYELLAGEYEALGDSVQFLKILEEGADKYPKNQYFLPNLINQYIKYKKYDEAVLYLDTAISNNPDNSCDLNSTKGSLFAEMQEYDKSKEMYEVALDSDPNCEKGLDGLSVLYMVQAQNLKDQASKISSNKERTILDDKAKKLYKEALPLLEKYKKLLLDRSADKSELSSVVYKLQIVYYNLNMNNEFDKASEELESLK